MKKYLTFIKLLVLSIMLLSLWSCTLENKENKRLDENTVKSKGEYWENWKSLKALWWTVDKELENIENESWKDFSSLESK